MLQCVLILCLLMVVYQAAACSYTLQDDVECAHKPQAMIYLLLPVAQLAPVLSLLKLRIAILKLHNYCVEIKLLSALPAVAQRTPTLPLLAPTRV
jgi:hypothetical protein